MKITISFSLTILFLFVVNVGQSQTTINDKPCPNSIDMGGTLCMYITGRNIDPSGEFDFVYQRIVHEAACVEKTDSEEVKIEKIQKMWKEIEDQIICNNVAFSVQDGSAVMFAIDVLNDDFIFDVTYMWKVDLNYVYGWHKRTVLDFAREKIEGNIGSALEGRFRSYYDQLRAAGAKHRSEL